MGTKVRELTELLDLKIEEEFTLQYEGESFLCKYTEDRGLKHKKDDGKWWLFFGYTEPLLTGEATIMGQKPQNKMTEVAKMFGKSLDEKFEVFIEDLGFYDVKFTEDGLITLDVWGSPVEQEETHVCLQDLFTGDAVITE